MRFKLVRFACFPTLFLLMSTLNGFGTESELTHVFQAKEYIASTGKKLLYRIYFPDESLASPAKKYPLVLFFHGAGERGIDNERQMKNGVRDLFEYTKTSDNPAIIVAPQCPEEKQWVDVPWGDDSHVMPEVPSESMALVIELFDQLRLDPKVDSTRMYVTGLSMGGFATWDILQRFPDRFTAAVVVCGGGDTAMAERLKGIPLWAFHGSADTVVQVKRSRDMIEAIKAVGGSPLYTEYAGVGHDSWTQTYADKRVLEWLFSQGKTAAVFCE